ncbi:hypothetical protein KM043_015021 [Ampulex compressa]|nr:hypothetical protein KM043_015021 [Ampulex compressa]
MVVASASGEDPVSGTSEKLRRSRRLSSTRGLKPRAPCERGVPDLNQKLGLCPIVSRNAENDSRGRSLMDWEVNERISLSSGSSAGLEVRTDTKKGIELSDNRGRSDLESCNRRSSNREDDHHPGGQRLDNNNRKAGDNPSERNIADNGGLKIDLEKGLKEDLENGIKRNADNRLKPDIKIEQSGAKRFEHNHTRPEVDAIRASKSDLEGKSHNYHNKTHLQNGHARVEERKPESKDNPRGRPELETIIKRSEESRGRSDPRATSGKLDGRRDLGLMNVSGFPRASDSKLHRASWEIEIDVIERRAEDNILKSDSKYEIGVPSQAKKSKQRRQFSGGTTKTAKSGKSEGNQTGRWSVAKDKMDKANDSISKRLELIHELNQKILANYERFQQRSKRGHSKESKEASKEQAPKGRGSLAGSKEEIYAEVKRRGRSKIELELQRCQDSSRQQKVDTSKFTFSKDYCQRLTSAKDRFEGSQRKRASRNQAISRISRDNENFSMASRPGFSPREESKPRDRLGKLDAAESRILEKEAPARKSVFYTDQEASSKKSPESGFCEKENPSRKSVFYTDNELCSSKREEIVTSDSKDLDKGISNGQPVFYVNRESKKGGGMNSSETNVYENEVSGRKSVFYTEGEFCPSGLEDIRSSGLKAVQEEITKRNSEFCAKSRLKPSDEAQSVESKLLQNEACKINSMFQSEQGVSENLKKMQTETSKTSQDESPKANSILQAPQKLYSKKPKIIQTSESQIIEKALSVEEAPLHFHQKSLAKKPEEKDTLVSQIISSKIPNTNVTFHANQKFCSKKHREVESQESKTIQRKILDTKPSFHNKEDSFSKQIRHSSQSPCLNNSNQYPTSYAISNSESTWISVTSNSKLPEEMSEIEEDDRLLREVRLEADSKTSRLVNQDQKSLENEILDNLDKTIGRFDSEKANEGARFSIENSNSENQFNDHKPNEENLFNVETIDRNDRFNTEKMDTERPLSIEKINKGGPSTIEKPTKEGPSIIQKSNEKHSLTIQRPNEEDPSVISKSKDKHSFIIQKSNEKHLYTIQKSNEFGSPIVQRSNEGASTRISKSNSKVPLAIQESNLECPLAIQEPKRELSRRMEKSNGEGSFDGERTDVSGQEGSDSFSTDSIQSCSPSSGAKEANGQEAFNSSWDSGVGVDVGTGSGWVRIHTGIESSLVYLTLDTTAKDVCRDMLLGADLSLFIQSVIRSTGLASLRAKRDLEGFQDGGERLKSLSRNSHGAIKGELWENSRDELPFHFLAEDEAQSGSGDERCFKRA